MQRKESRNLRAPASGLSANGLVCSRFRGCSGGGYVSVFIPGGFERSARSLSQQRAILISYATALYPSAIEIRSAGPDDAEGIGIRPARARLL